VPGLLFLHGGAELGRHVLAVERRGYWSPALPVVLEKHGYIAVDARGPEALTDPELFSSYDCAIIGRLADDAWRDEVLDAVLGSGIPVLFEPPLPARLREALGILSAEPIGQQSHDLLLNLTDVALAAQTRSFGYAGGGRIRPPRSDPDEREQRIDWATLGSVPLEADQAAAWREPGYDVERWTLAPEVEVLAAWSIAETGERRPAIIRRGCFVAASFSLAAFLARAHTAEPWYRGERLRSQRSTGIEFMLLALIDQLHASAGATRPRVLPWPRGASWAMNVRHDFDRPLGRATVAAIGARHEALGTAPTWYWRARHLRSGLRRLSVRRGEREGNAAIQEVAHLPAQEIAHHTEMLWAGAEQEQRTIEAVSGRRVRGACSHGDPTCFRFQGAPNVLWAERQRLLYTELIQHGHYHPHRFPALSLDGTVEPLNVICLPHHESFDRSTVPGDVAMERLAAAPDTWSPIGGMLQVMNHPDINIDQLFELLEGMPRQGRLDWTAERCADWWRRTHVIDELELRALGNGRFSARSREGVEGVVVELREPDGQTSARSYNLPAGEEIQLT
jgi:hypothetical protein